MLISGSVARQRVAKILLGLVLAPAACVLIGCGDSAPEGGMPLTEEEDAITDEAVMEEMTAENIGGSTDAPP